MVSQRKDGGEATGYEEGRRIVEMLHRKKSELTDQNYGHMGKVLGYLRAPTPEAGRLEGQGRGRELPLAVVADELGP